MHSLVNFRYFYWLFAILLCSDWLVYVTINQNYYLSSALHNPSCRVSLFFWLRFNRLSRFVTSKISNRSEQVIFWNMIFTSKPIISKPLYTPELYKPSQNRFFFYFAHSIIDFNRCPQPHTPKQRNKSNTTRQPTPILDFSLLKSRIEVSKNLILWNLVFTSKPMIQDIAYWRSQQPFMTSGVEPGE